MVLLPGVMGGVRGDCQGGWGKVIAASWLCRDRSVGWVDIGISMGGMGDIGSVLWLCGGCWAHGIAVSSWLCGIAPRDDGIADQCPGFTVIAW